MQETILERLAQRASRSNNLEEQQLERKTKKALSNIKYLQTRTKKKHETRGGLYSMGARGVFVKEGDIYSRRVIIKARIRKNHDEHFKEKLRKHLEYMTRKGAGKDGEKPELFSGSEETPTLKNIKERFSESPHNFRMIISPEDSDKIDLKYFTKNLIKIIEQDINKKLDWVATIHHDTNEPHIHLLINGNDGSGKRLLMTRDYISNGIRNRASQLISNKIGLRDWNEVVKSLNLEISKARKCGLDNIIKKHSNNDELNLNKLSDNDLDDIPKTLFQKRLTYLESKGLAEQVEKGVWRTKENYIDTLRELDRTNNIIEKLCSNLKIKQSCEKITINSLLEKPINGHVVKRGYVDELNDKEYLIIQTKDDKHFLVELEKYSEKVAAKPGELIQVETTKALSGPKTSDKTIDQEAQANGGVYDANDHAKHASVGVRLPPGVSAKEYAQVHIKRLEVLARRGLVEKLSEGRFSIPKDYLEKLSTEAKKSQDGFTPHIKVTRLKAAKVHEPKLSQGLKPC